ncbi:uncharacterized protein LOC121931380 isoform X2 [Sceloporus undulatus]|uniref:uncharacterized protein LOC121931380 isoform X2 n=1 Tax=Sceloporus undulatus TaxID=8520 RepID=UPI001C4B10E5|nr:uncharacterized protein LOC121931380 isoform X2 [Sceloporus undulatus]
MRVKGHNRTLEECRRKCKSLKSQYKQYRDALAKGTTKGAPPPFYKELHAFIKSDGSIRPHRLATSGERVRVPAGQPARAEPVVVVEEEQEETPELECAQDLLMPRQGKMCQGPWGEGRGKWDKGKMWPQGGHRPEMTLVPCHIDEEQEEEEEHPDSGDSSSSQRPLDPRALLRRMSAEAGSSRRRPPSRAGSSSTTSSYRDRSPLSRASAPASDGSETEESMQGGRTEAEQEEEGEGEPPPANPIAAMSAEERLATKKKRVRPSAATRTVAAVDKLTVCSEEKMTELMQQGQRACDERERSRHSRRELMERALGFQERALGFQERALEVQLRGVQNQETALERSDQHHETTVQEQRRLNTTMEAQTVLMGQMLEVMRGGLGGPRRRRVRREQGGRGRAAVPRVVEEGVEQQEPPARGGRARAVPRVVEEEVGPQEPPARAIPPAEEQAVAMEVEPAQQPLAGPSSSLFSQSVAVPPPTPRPQRQRATRGGLGSRGREH